MLKYCCETLLFKLYVVLNYTSSQYICEKLVEYLHMNTVLQTTDKKAFSQYFAL